MSFFFERWNYIIIYFVLVNIGIALFTNRPITQQLYSVYGIIHAKVTGKLGIIVSCSYREKIIGYMIFEKHKKIIYNSI